MSKPNNNNNNNNNSKDKGKAKSPVSLGPVGVKSPKHLRSAKVIENVEDVLDKAKEKRSKSAGAEKSAVAEKAAVADKSVVGDKNAEADKAEVENNVNGDKDEEPNEGNDSDSSESREENPPPNDKNGNDKEKDDQSKEDSEEYEESDSEPEELGAKLDGDLTADDWAAWSTLFSKKSGDLFTMKENIVIAKLAVSSDKRLQNMFKSWKGESIVEDKPGVGNSNAEYNIFKLDKERLDNFRKRCSESKLGQLFVDGASSLTFDVTNWLPKMENAMTECHIRKDATCCYLVVECYVIAMGNEESLKKQFIDHRSKKYKFYPNNDYKPMSDASEYVTEMCDYFVTLFKGNVANPFLSMLNLHLTDARKCEEFYTNYATLYLRLFPNKSLGDIGDATKNSEEVNKFHYALLYSRLPVFWQNKIKESSYVRGLEQAKTLKNWNQAATEIKTMLIDKSFVAELMKSGKTDRSFEEGKTTSMTGNDRHKRKGTEHLSGNTPKVSKTNEKHICNICGVWSFHAEDACSKYKCPKCNSQHAKKANCGTTTITSDAVATATEPTTKGIDSCLSFNNIKVPISSSRKKSKKLLKTSSSVILDEKDVVLSKEVDINLENKFINKSNDLSTFTEGEAATNPEVLDTIIRNTESKKIEQDISWNNIAIDNESIIRLGKDYELPNIPEFAHNVILFNDNIKKLMGEFIAVEDNGANRSLISSSLVKKLGLEKDILQTNRSIILADGEHTIKSLGNIAIVIIKGAAAYDYPFEIMPSKHDRIILGRDLLYLFNMIPIQAFAGNENSEAMTMDNPNKSIPKLMQKISDLKKSIMKNISSDEEKIEERLLAFEKLQNTDAFGNKLNNYEDPESRSKDYLTDLERGERDELLIKLNDYLAEYRKIIKPNDPCNLKEAIVRIIHEEGTLPKRMAQYKASSIRKPYMDAGVANWLAKGWAREGRSLWNNPLNGVDKRDKNGKLINVRITMDCSKTLNIGLANIDTFPIPKIKDLMEKLLRNEFIISDLDLKDAYFQRPIDERDVGKCGFTWNGKEYLLLRAPQGLTPMASEFQRLMNVVFAEFGDQVLCYLDNVWVVSDAKLGMKGHLELLRKVIARLAEVNLLLNEDKCQFALKTFTGLGHRITPEGIYIDQKRSDSIMALPKPVTFHDIHSFLGLTNQVRDHIRWYAAIVRPIQDLLDQERKQEGWTPKKKPSRVKGPEWDKIASRNFRILRYAIAHAPYISFPELKEDSILAIYIDASINGIGSALYELKNLAEPRSQKNLITFRSKALGKAQRNYAGSIYKLELYALVTALQEYDYYIRGRKVVVFTDHHALTYMNTQKNFNRHLDTWADIIKNYDFVVVHVPGKLNNFADALSRAPPFLWGLSDDGHKKVTDHNLAENVESYRPVGQVLPLDSTHKELEDDVIKWFAAKSDGESREISPENLVKLEKVHRIGHFGQKAMLDQLRANNIGWKGMVNDVIAYTGKCSTCLQWNSMKKLFNGMKSINAVKPWDFIELDFITSFKPTSDGFSCILVVVDIFTGFTILKAMKSHDAIAVSEALWEIFAVMGVPKTIQSDNEKGFTSDHMQELMKKLKINHILITPYHHRANGKVENMNKTVSACLNKYLTLRGGEWNKLVPIVNLAINAKIKELTEHSPFALMMNRSSNLFEDINIDMSIKTAKQNMDELLEYKPEMDIVKLKEKLDNDLKTWIEHQQKVIELFFPIASEIIKAKQYRQKKKFDARHNVVKEINFIPIGTTVYLLDPRRENKMAPPFIGPYTVEEMTDKDNFRIKDSMGNIYPRECVLDELKIAPYAEPPKNDEYYVEKILEHAQDEENDAWIYKIRWIGLGPEYDEWIPAAHIESNLVRDYMAKLSVLPKRNSTKLSAKFEKAVKVLKTVVGDSKKVLNKRKRKTAKNENLAKGLPSKKVYKSNRRNLAN